MARKVFFSFHYKRDSHRVAQIRNCNSISQHFERTPFLDRAEWESIKRKGTTAVKNWIDSNMYGTSVVVVCYGLETFTRPWVIYELEKAHREGRGIIAINMSRMLNLHREWDFSGQNPLQVAKDSSGSSLSTYGKYKTYHWLDNNGRENIDEWVDEAARLAGK